MTTPKTFHWTAEDIALLLKVIHNSNSKFGLFDDSKLFKYWPQIDVILQQPLFQRNSASFSTCTLLHPILLSTERRKVFGSKRIHFVSGPKRVRVADPKVCGYFWSRVDARPICTKTIRIVLDLIPCKQGIKDFVTVQTCFRSDGPKTLIPSSPIMLLIFKIQYQLKQVYQTSIA